jgi:hypothetical protein
MRVNAPNKIKALETARVDWRERAFLRGGYSDADHILNH